MLRIPKESRSTLYNTLNRFTMRAEVGAGAPVVRQELYFSDRNRKDFFFILIEGGYLKRIDLLEPKVSSDDDSWEDIAKILELFPWKNVVVLVDKENGRHGVLKILEAGLFSEDKDANNMRSHFLSK